MYLDSFIDYLIHQKRYSEHTVVAYRQDLEQFLAFMIHQYEITDISLIKTHHIRSYLVSLMDRDMGAKSVNRKISSIRTFFKFLMKEGRVDNNPAKQIKAPKIPKRLPVFLRKEEIHRILDEVVDIEDFASYRNHLIFNLFLLLGLRRAELLDLEPEHFDLSSSYVTITGKGNKQRRLPLPPMLKKKIIHYLTLRDQLEIYDNNLILTEFGEKMNPRTLYKIVNDYLRQMSSVSKQSPHVLRHSFATLLSDSGAQITAVKDLLGHANLAATQIYTHSSISTLKNAYLKAHPRS